MGCPLGEKRSRRKGGGAKNVLFIGDVPMSNKQHKFKKRTTAHTVYTETKYR